MDDIDNIKSNDNDDNFEYKNNDNEFKEVLELFRYASDTYVKQFTPTVGVEFYLKRTILPGPRHVALKVF